MAKRKSRGRNTYRSRPRAQAHADAMSDEPAEKLPPIPDHPLIPAGAPELIDTAEGLREFMGHVASVGCCAYDTEFIGELSYFPHLCLLQIGTAERLALVDPIGGLDLTPLWESIADPAVETIVHAGTQDLEPVVRLLDAAPRRIFDTQIACGFIGLPYPLGLRKVIFEMTGVQLGKGMTFTQWDQRPLSPRHLRYAADDVRYLPAARAEIGRRLQTLAHESWAQGEFDLLSDPDLYRFDPDSQVFRVRGGDGLDARGLAVLRELVAERDALAREHDSPPRSLIKDELLVRIVRGGLDTIEKLQELPGLPRNVVREDGPRLLAAIARGREAPPIKRPTVFRDEDSKERVRLDGLLAAATSYCLGRSIDPSLVLSRADITSWYRQMRQGRDRSAHRLEQGWRGELLRPLFERFVGGSADLRMKWHKDQLAVDLQGYGPECTSPLDPPG